MWLEVLCLCLVLKESLTDSETFPDYKNANIVFIIADDLGWDDVSFHGSDQVLTPNIDLLAYTGVALSRYYSHSVCTPSRTAILSGKFAHTLGMQGYPLTNGEDRGIPLNIKLLPEHLKDAGYETHLVGKWHVGHSRKQYLPTSRGFDSHFGHRCGFIDYYDYTSEEYAHLCFKWTVGPVSGLDMYRNLTAAWDIEGYITDVYTKEAVSIIRNHERSKPLFLMVTHNAPHAGNLGAILQAPPEEVRKMRHLESPSRRIFAAMVKKLDDSVGEIFKALHDKKILNKTIIVFVSDNGGMSSGDSMNYASNWPLRGLKTTPFEGGIRVTGLMWTSTVHNHVWNGYMHASDWLPTLLGAIGTKPASEIDGYNLWDEIINDRASKREDMYEISDASRFASIISGKYKFVIGDIDAKSSDHQGEDMRGTIGKRPSYPDLILNSSVFSVLNQTSKIFTFEKILARDDIKIRCGDFLNSTSNGFLCQPSFERGCLFDIENDPCELKDISEDNPNVLRTLSSKLNIELKRVVQRKPLYRDETALPKLHNFTWATFKDSSI